MDGERGALVLDARARVGQHRRQAPRPFPEGLERGDQARVRAVELVLRAVVADDVRGLEAEPVPDVQDLAAADDRDRHALREPREQGRRARRDARLVRMHDDGRERAVEIETKQRSAGHEAGERGAALRVEQVSHRLHGVRASSPDSRARRCTRRVMRSRSRHWPASVNMRPAQR